MINRYTTIHNAVVLIHNGEQDDPVRVQGHGDWENEPTEEQYQEVVIKNLVNSGFTDDPRKVRMVEFTYTTMDPEIEES